MLAQKCSRAKSDGYTEKAAGLILGAAVGTACLIAARAWYCHWGATRAECREILSGDELTPHATETSTHAITIHAPVSAVWPWLVQIGRDKGGFYSYAWLENLVGCQLHNADQVLPEFQHIAVGDKVWLHPKAPPLPVVHTEWEQSLVMGSNTEEPGTWGFYLREAGPNACRLIVRSRTRRSPGLFRWLGQYGLFEPAHFIMQRKMLLTLKANIEAAVAKTQTGSQTPLEIVKAA